MPTGHYERKPRVARIRFVCEVCGAEIWKLPSFVKIHGPSRFCSTKCAGESQIKQGSHREVVCSTCGVIFKKRTDHIREKSYCSKKCLSAGTRVDGAKWRDPSQIKEYMRNYVQSRQAQHNQRNRKWASENREKKLAIQKRYRQTHAEFLAACARARRFGLKASSFTQHDWDAMKQLYDYKCLCCGKSEPEIRLEPDHIVAFTNGGTHDFSNIQPLCRHCNASKGANTVDYRGV